MRLMSHEKYRASLYSTLLWTDIILLNRLKNYIFIFVYDTLRIFAVFDFSICWNSWCKAIIEIDKLRVDDALTKRRDTRQ